MEPYKILSGALDRFWLDGPLEISAVEQAHLLSRLARDELPFPPEAQAAVRDIIKLEDGLGWALHGKTGTAAKYAPKLGWWVGWVEKSGRVYAFALNIDLQTPEDAAKRIDLGRACLKALGILEEDQSVAVSAPAPANTAKK